MRKLIKIIACMLILSIVVIAVAACVKNGDDKKPTDNSKVNISTLPDMVDYGQSAYINVARVNYTEQDRDNWNQKLTDSINTAILHRTITANGTGKTAIPPTP